MERTSGHRAIVAALAASLLGGALALGCPSPSKGGPDAGQAPTAAGSDAGAPQKLGTGNVFPVWINDGSAGFTPRMTMPASASGGGLIVDGSAPTFSFYVNKGGSDANLCSLLSPCLTIARAESLVKGLSGLGLVETGAGYDTAVQYAEIFLGPGNYQEVVPALPWLYVVAQDIAGTSGIQGVSIDPSYYLTSGVTFSGFTGLLIGGDFPDGGRPPDSVLDFNAGGHAIPEGEVNFQQCSFATNLTATAAGTSNTEAVTFTASYFYTTNFSAVGVYVFSSKSTFGSVSCASTSTNQCGWQSQQDTISFGSTPSVFDSTAGQIVSAYMVDTAVDCASGGITLTGSLTTYSATAGGIPPPWCVTLTPFDGGVPALVPLTGINTLSTDGGTIGQVATICDAGAGVLPVWCPQSVEAGSSFDANTLSITGGVACTFSGGVCASTCTGATGSTLGCVQLAGDLQAGTASSPQVGGLCGSEIICQATGELRWSSGATAMTLDAVSTSATPGVDLRLKGQVSTANPGTSGNVVAVLTPPVGAGSEAHVYIDRTLGTHYFAFGAYPGFESSDGAFWIGAPLTLDAAHIFGYSNGTDSRINGSASAGFTLSGINALLATFSTSEVGVAAGFNFNIGATSGSYGGGVGVLGLHNAGTNPTTVPTAEGVVWEGLTGDGLHGTGPSGAGYFNDWMFSPTASPSPGNTALNTQATLVHVPHVGYARTSTTAAVAVYNFPLASGHAVGVHAYCTGRLTANGSGCSGSCLTGGSVYEEAITMFTNVSGTLTQGNDTIGGSGAPVAQSAISSLVPAITFTNPSTNLVQLNVAQTNGTTAVDWTCWDESTFD